MVEIYPVVQKNEHNCFSIAFSLEDFADGLS